jgi:hypothetical protein
MQKSLFTACLMAFSILLFGQSKPDKIENFGDRRTELYYFSDTNYDSTRFMIQGKNDTLWVESFYRNGRLEEKRWRRDSVYWFSSQGFINSKKFTINGVDSTLALNNDGSVKESKVVQKNVFLREINYYGNGVIEEREELYKVGSHGEYWFVANHLGKLCAHFSDTITEGKKTVIWQYDTLYYRNGQPLYISVQNDSVDYLIQNHYDDKGQLIEAITPKKNALIPFKDNLDCYYGFKNSKGDTIIAPRFERYEVVDEGFWAVYEGTKCRLMRFDGTFLATPDMEDVKKLEEEEGFLSADNNQLGRRFSSPQYPSFIENYSANYVNYPAFADYFTYSIGGKHGVIDRKGNLIMAPQYFKLDRYVDGGQLFSFYERTKDDKGIFRTGYLNRSGTSLFPNYSFSRIPNDRKYVEVREKNKDTASIYQDFIYGLIDKDGTEILPCKFNDLREQNAEGLFIASIKQHRGKAEKNGLFDAKKRKWVLDTVNFLIGYGFSNGLQSDDYCIFQSKKTQKYGAFNEAGEIAAPTIYQALRLVDNSGFFIAKNQKGYSFMSINNKKKRRVYEHLAPLLFDVKLDGYAQAMPLFVAQSKGKWGIIDSNDVVLKPFTADYAGTMSDINSPFYNSILLVEKNRVTAFNAASFPREERLKAFFRREKRLLNAYLVGESSSKSFFFNANGDVLIPPQYKILNNMFVIDREEDNTEFYQIEDAQKRNKIVFLKTGKIIDFPFDYEVKFANAYSKIMIVSDRKVRRDTMKFGVVSVEGKELNKPINYGVAINSGIIFDSTGNGVYFVKLEQSIINDRLEGRLNTMDTLTSADSQWFMYNTKGELVHQNPFRYPFHFDDELGIGMQGDTFNLYRKDGSRLEENTANFSPPQYRNMRRDEKTGFLYLYHNQGLVTTVTIKKRDGKTLLPSGRYDGAGVFYGKYALVSLAGKVGLIDSFGNEIIAPQDLRIYNVGNLCDSINAENKRLKKQLDAFSEGHSFGEIREMQDKIRNSFVDIYESEQNNNPDSLNLSPTFRNTLWHLILEKRLNAAIWKVNDFNFERSYSFTKDNISYSNLEDYNKTKIQRITTSDKTLAFAFSTDYRGDYFYNFYQRNNRWNDLTINDLLNIQGDKRWQFNDLLMRKVKAMKDEEIDCSNTSALVTQVENRFMLTREGVDFCFVSLKNSSNFAIVSFSWVELEPFLKMRL